MSSASVRYRISSAIQDAIDDRGQKAIGSIVGHAASTISRWQADLGSWSASALIDLASRDASVAEELIAALSELRSNAARHTTAEVDSCRAIAASSELSAELARDLADGRIDERERAELRPHVRAAIDSLTTLMADL